jgi:type II secretory pathway component PulK
MKKRAVSDQRSARFSNPWKMKRSAFPRPGNRDASALIVVLWILLLLALLISSMAYDMHVEAGITTYQRNRVQAQQCARAGVEFARYLLWKAQVIKPEMGLPSGEDEEVFLAATRVQRGLALTNYVREFETGRFVLEMIPEQAFRNVNKLDETDWPAVLAQAGIPEDRWPELMDCFQDWTDANDTVNINGAEEDDAFYVERGYPPKNAKLDTVEELLMIKGFTKAIVFGGANAYKDAPPVAGLAPLLTVWGDGRVNVNAASREVLLTILTVDEAVADDIIAQRAGADGIPDTLDDGFTSVNDVLSRTRTAPEIQRRITTGEHHFMRVVVRGECAGVRSGIRCVLWSDDRKIQPVFWREGETP